MVNVRSSPTVSSFLRLVLVLIIDWAEFVLVIKGPVSNLRVTPAYTMVSLNKSDESVSCVPTIVVMNLGYLSSLGHASDVQMRAEELEGIGRQV